VPDRQVEALSPDDARAVLAAVAGSRLDALVTLVLYTGLRQGEAPGLRWSDVDVDAHLLTVRMSLQRDSTIALTANTCTGVLPALQREASDRLAALLGSPAADHR
jgi:integrase